MVNHPRHSSKLSAPRKALIYLGTSISVAGMIIFFAGFFSFGLGFIELIQLDRTGSIAQQNRISDDIFARMVATTLPRFFVGMAMVGAGTALAKVGKRGLLGLTDDDTSDRFGGFYVEQYINEGGTMNEDRSVHIQASSGGNVVYAGQDISGTVTTTIQHLQHSQHPNAQQLASLLSQLQQAIEADPALTGEDKADALEQVKVLAEVGNHPQEKAAQKLARNAIRILQGTAAALPTATEFLNACSTLLPSIYQLLALL
jgi:hypothetical protein